MQSEDDIATIPRMARAGARRFGDRLLILRAEQRLSYQEADLVSAGLARSLIASGLGKGSRVGILLPNGPDWVVSWLAAARIGATVIPLSTFYTEPELAWVMRHADVQTLFTLSTYQGNDYLAHLETHAVGLAGQPAGFLAVPELPALRAVYTWDAPEVERSWVEPAREISPGSRGPDAVDPALLEAIEQAVTPADPMTVIYSSGSSGQPKGAVHSHGAVIRQASYLSSLRSLGPDDRIYSPMPFFWVGGFVYTLVSAMVRGSGILCDVAFDAGATLALLEREHATVVDGFPQHEKAMCEHQSFLSRDLSSVRAGSLAALLPERLRPKDPELRSNSLGMTETCAAHAADRSDVDLPESSRGSFGKPVPGVQHKIVDPETGQPLAPGVEGEICVRGRSLLQALYKVEREETFDSDGYYHTGDAGYFNSDGVLFFSGRLGEMIKTGGANVTPSEVEGVLESFPEVELALVVGVPDPVRGQNVAAAVVPVRGAALEAKELHARLRPALSTFKVPRHLFLLQRDELPLTDTGKVDKRTLSLELAERVEGESESRSGLS